MSNDSVRTAKTTESAAIIKSGRLVIYREATDVYSKKRMELIITLFQCKVFSVKPGSSLYYNHYQS